MSNVNILNLPVAVSLDGTEYIPLVQGLSSDAVTRRATAAMVGAIGIASVLPGSIEFLIDGAGGTISSKVWGQLTIPFDATLTGAVIVADQTGSIAMDVWSCTYAQYDPPTTPTAANSICGGNPPVIVAATKSTSSLSGWSTSLNERDILTFYVSATSTTITRVTLSLNLTRVVTS